MSEICGWSDEDCPDGCSSPVTRRCRHGSGYRGKFCETHWAIHFGNHMKLAEKRRGTKPASFFEEPYAGKPVAGVVRITPSACEPES